MSDVIGPNRYLPGDDIKLNGSHDCINCVGKNATHAVVGETDSMGSEIIHMCDECYKKFREEEKTRDTSGICDWCKEHKPKLIPKRDIEEGFCGPVYSVCPDCIRKENQRLREELEEDYCDWD